MNAAKHGEKAAFPGASSPLLLQQRRCDSQTAIRCLADAAEAVNLQSVSVTSRF